MPITDLLKPGIPKYMSLISVSNDEKKIILEFEEEIGTARGEFEFNGTEWKMNRYVKMD